MRQVRLFTRVEAERTLPLVRRIVADIQEEHGRWRTAMRQYEIAAAGVRAEWGEPPELIRLWGQVAAHAGTIAGCLAELDTIGCLLKGFDTGTVDFPALREERVVLLCWCPGEERITHWHEMDAGFRGRQPIEHSTFSEVLS